MKPKNEVGIGILGLGVVGSGVAKFIYENNSQLRKRTGCSIALKGILVRNLAKTRAYQAPSKLLTTDINSILNNPKVNIIVEVMGGQDPALRYIQQSISSGKHIVTANKEIIARYGTDIFNLARSNDVQVLFEASVAGGTPIIGPLQRDLLPNDITMIRAIINGTTNYILTRMSDQGKSFVEALEEAQNLGYAESDPTNDVEGIDAAYKLAILSSLAFHTSIKDSDINREGITRLTPLDFAYARELGYTIKLLAIANKDSATMQMRVHPSFVPNDVMMAKVDGVLNAIEIETDLAGTVLFYGRGAGSEPTTSAVVANIVDIARNIADNITPSEPLTILEDLHVRPMIDLETKYYLRLNVSDRPGVFAKIAKLLGEMQISISSVIQKETDDVAQRAEIVLMTHRAQEGAMQQAIKQLSNLDVVNEVGSLIRVEEWT